MEKNRIRRSFNISKSSHIFEPKYKIPKYSLRLKLGDLGVDVIVVFKLFVFTLMRGFMTSRTEISNSAKLYTVPVIMKHLIHSAVQVYERDPFAD